MDVTSLFLGSGAFAVPILDALLHVPGIVVTAVFTGPPRAARPRSEPRATPVAERAAADGIDVLTPPTLKGTDALVLIADLHPQLIVLADYGRIVPQAVLDVPAHGALNLHPSLLPRHRGASPIPAAILAGDRETGVSLMRMDAGVDTGPLIAQRAIPLGTDVTTPALEATLAAVGARLLAETLPDWMAGRLRTFPQPAETATLTPILRRTDGQLDPSRPAERLARQVRAYQPWPGSFVKVDGHRLIVWSARAQSDAAGGGEGLASGGEALASGGEAEAGAEEALAAEPGRLVALDHGIALRTTDGLLVLLEVQPASGRRMSGAEFRRGHPLLPIDSKP